MTGCRKYRFRDELAAKFTLARIHRQDKPDRPKTETRTYRCPNCHAWHLTSSHR